MRRYADAKMAVSVFSRRLTTTVSSNEVIVNNVCPGMVAMGFDKTLPAWIRIPFEFIRAVVARTVEEGSRALVHGTVVFGSETHDKFTQHNKIDS